MSPTFISGVACVKISFFKKPNSIPLYVYSSVFVSIHLSTHIWGCFHLLAAVNNATVKVGIQRFVWELSVFNLKNYVIGIYSLGLEHYIFLFGLIFFILD